MKNNEYNIVYVTNEKSTYVPEYTNAPKVEYSFQSENRNPNKDELNDRHTINDKVEENTLKKSKPKDEERKRRDADKASESSSGSSAASSSGAVSASAGSTGAAAASSGASVGHVVAAAATVSVAAVGSIVGINIVNKQETAELAKFLSSEISTTGIEFSFSMPAKLLAYDEKEEQSDSPIQKNVVANLKSGGEFEYEEYLWEYEELDDNNLVFYASLDGLNPDTSYVLTVSLKYERYDTEDKPLYKELAQRVFRTERVGQETKFEYVEATYNAVSFCFIVDKLAVDYKEELGMPSIKATISDNGAEYQEAWIEGLEERDEYTFIGYGDFLGLTGSTTYTLSLYVSLEQELKFLGSTVFTTEAAPTSEFSFDTVEPDMISVTFSFFVNPEYVGYEERVSEPDIYAEVTASGQSVSSSEVSSFMLVDSMLKGEGVVVDLEPSTSYTLSIYYNHDNKIELLGSEEFTTLEAPSSDFYFNSIIPTYNSVSFIFFVNPEYVGYEEGVSTPDINANVTLEGRQVAVIAVSSFSIVDSMLKGEGTIEGLEQTTTYVLNVFYNHDNEAELLGNEEFTTVENPGVFEFESVEPTYNYVSFSFIVDKNTVNYDPDAGRTPAIQATVSGEGSDYQEKWLDSYEEYDEDTLIFYGDFDSLTEQTTYTLTIYVSLETEFKELGSTTFTTTQKPSSGFTWGKFTPTDEAIEFAFYVNSSYIGYVEGESFPSLYAVVSATGTNPISYTIQTLSTFSSTVCKAEGTIHGLTGSTDYTITIYYEHDGSSEELKSREFTTEAPKQTFYFAEYEFFYVGDNYISPLFYIKKSEVQEITRANASGTNINVSISGGMAYTQTVNIAMSDFSEPQDTDYYMARPTFENLDANIAYTITVTDSLSGTEYGSTTVTTTDSAGIGFEVLSVTPTAYDVQASFYLSTSYVSDTNNVSATVMTKDGSTVSSSPARLSSTVDDKYEFNVSVSGLDANTDYVMGFYYSNGNSNSLVGTYDFTTEEYTGPSFNGATIPPEVSFFSHQFDITLDFVDDTSQPTFTALKIVFYNVGLDDEERSQYALSSPIDLLSSTESQSVTIPQETAEQEPYYYFGFEDVHSYDILNGDEVVYQADITFIDTDPPGEITGVSNLHCSVDASTGNFYLVLQLGYTDDYDKLSSFYISVTPDQAGAEASSNASIIKSTDYQLAVFEDTSSTGNQGVISYLDGGGTSFTVNIYNWNDQQVPIYTEENVTIVKESSNIFYSAKISTTEFSQDDYEFRFDELVYVCGDPSHLSTAQIIFYDESTGREAFKWNFPLGNPSYLPPSFSLMDAVDQGFQSYSDIVSAFSAFSGKTFEIVIQFPNRAGTSMENYPIASGVSFTFN